jgi:hypothetical protein
MKKTILFLLLITVAETAQARGPSLSDSRSQRPIVTQGYAKVPYKAKDFTPGPVRINPFCLPTATK